MTNYTPLDKYPYAGGTDGPLGPTQLQNLALALENTTQLVFASAAARDSLIRAPVTGMRAFLQDVKACTYYDGSAWQNEGLNLISQTVLNSTSGLVAFNSIPQTYTNLHMTIATRLSSTSSTGYDPVQIQMNGITSNSYNAIQWFSNVGTAGSVSSHGNAHAEPSWFAGMAWNNFYATLGMGYIDIIWPGYSNSSFYKSYLSRDWASDGGSAGYGGLMVGGESATTSAITSLQFFVGTGGGNFLNGSVFTLYGE